MPVKLSDWQSPFEKLYGKSPTYDHLRVIGCLCYATNIRPHKDKFINRRIKSMLVSYPVNQNGYKLYNWETKEVFLSRDVVFEENIFLFRQIKTPTIPHLTLIYLTFETHDEEMTEPVNPNTPLSAEPNISDATTDNIPLSNYVLVNPTPIVSLRKSSRNTTRPAWLQDFVTPKSLSSTTSIPRLTTAKPFSFPLLTQLKLSLDKGTPLSDVGSYRRLVGRLLMQMRYHDDPIRSLGLKIEIPEFTGNVHLYDFINWLSTVERVFNVRDIPDKLKVKLVAIKLRQHASLWWDHINKRKTKHDGFQNSYNFKKDGVNITLVPFDSRQTHAEGSNLFMKKTGFEELMKTSPYVFTLVVVEENEITSEAPLQVQPLLREFADVIPDDIPPGLPAIRDIQHCIDFILVSTIPNRPAYRMNLDEFAELQR
ncbi:reverse transcriptase domain-containing protein [Tanacetum coccineum]|uniref:Reverse transcriptase domain-containing protein n=1 Tax=Tanacetum coccineum TaxID=301880 RepID=A0ABQ5FFI7_9ASTR